MASYLDEIPKFGEYIPEFSLDILAKVGTYKQEKYEQNVQAIQSSIDKIHELDISRPQDKAILQSRLDELGGKLRTFAAGDFSNFQLANSVAGMTKQLVRDPTIQNAVASTAHLRKQQKAIEEARKSGKSSTQNEAWFNEDVNKWYNDPTPGAKFTSEFIQYNDVDKKLREIADKLHEVDSSIDIPYKRDNAGNVIYGKDGKPMVDDAMLRIKTKGKPAEKILSTFYESLTEDDMRQLRIDGWYHYKGADKNTFKNQLITNYNQNKNMLSDQLVNLNLELDTNKKLDASQRGEITAKINAIEKSFSDGSLRNKLDKDLSEIDNIQDLTDYKYKLYTQTHLTNLAKDLSYQSYQTEYLSNPYAQMAMERANLQFRYDDAARQQRNSDRTYALDVLEFKFGKEKFYTEQAQKQAAALGSLPVVVPGALPTDVDRPNLAQIDREITLGKEEKDLLSAKYAPLIVNSKLKTVDEKSKYLKGLLDKYMEDPSSINSIKDPNVRDYLEKARALEISIGQKQNLYTSTVEASKVFDEKLKQTVGKENSLKIGSTIISANELYDFDRDVSTFYKTLPGTGAYSGGSMGMGITSGGGTTSGFDYNGLMAKYKGTKYEPIAKAYAKKYLRQDLTPGEKLIVNTTRDIGSKYREVGLNINQEKIKFQSDFIAQRMPERQTQLGTLSKDNTIDMDHINQLIGNKIKEHSTYGAIAGIRDKSDFDPSTVGELQGNKDVKYTIEKKYDGSANLTVTSEGKTQIIPMNAAELSAYFPNYARRSSINDIKYAVMASPNHTTNLVGGNDPSTAVNAFLSGYDIPNLKNTSIAPIVRLDVEGSPFNNGSDLDKYVVRMYVNDNGVWKSDILTQEGYVSESALETIINNIGPATVADLLKQNR